MDTQPKNENELENAERYVLYLIRCSLNGCTPTKEPVNCSWNQILYLAEKNSVTSMISPAVKEYKYDIPQDIREKIESALARTVYRILRFQIERENIFSAMEQCGIWYLPLKGILLAEYYPKAGMRWMCDNDILYGGSDLDMDWQIKQLKKIMKDLGYDAEHIGGVHDVYQKKPFFNFEMHRKLVSADSPFAEYYKNPWKKAVLTEGKKCEYHFRDEDEYIFMLAHAYKHFDNSGCGIRTLADEYVFLNKKDSMNWEYINKELDKIGLISFEKELRKAACDTFSREGMITETDWDMISYMFDSGTYGLKSNDIRHKLERIYVEAEQNHHNLNSAGIRRRYWKQRFYISDLVMKENYPFLYRHKRLRFVLPFYRVIKGLVIHPKTLYHEWKSVREFK